MQDKIKTNKGTTLIEVIIYIALFSVLLGTAFVTAIEIMNGSNKIDSNVTLQEESNFVLRKIDWLLTSLDPVNPPVVSGAGCLQTLTVQKVNYSLNPVIIRINLEKLEIKQGSGSFIPITTNNVKVNCLNLKINKNTTTNSTGITATTTINGIDFSITKYLRN